MKRSNQKRAHDVLVGEFALAVLSLADDHVITLRALECDDHKLATSTVVDGKYGAERVALQPDLLVMTETPNGPRVLLVEIDRGTTSVKRLVEKYRGYLAWKRDGGPERDHLVRALQVATIVPNERRLASLRDAIFRANGERRSGFLLFAKSEDISVVVAERLTDPIAEILSSGDADRVPLFELPARDPEIEPPSPSPSTSSTTICLPAPAAITQAPGNLSAPGSFLHADETRNSSTPGDKTPVREGFFSRLFFSHL
jgi:hypothetical protein